MQTMFDRLIAVGIPQARCQAYVFGGGNMFPHVFSTTHVGAKNAQWVLDYCTTAALPWWANHWACATTAGGVDGGARGTRWLKKSSRRCVGASKHSSPPCFRGRRASGTVTEAIGVLVVLQHSHQCAAHRQAGTVQRVHQLILALGVLEAGLQAPGLEGFAVGHRADLAVGVLCR